MEINSSVGLSVNNNPKLNQISAHNKLLELNMSMNNVNNINNNLQKAQNNQTSMPSSNTINNAQNSQKLQQPNNNLNINISHPDENSSKQQSSSSLPMINQKPVGHLLSGLTEAQINLMAKGRVNNLINKPLSSYAVASQNNITLLNSSNSNSTNNNNHTSNQPTIVRTDGALKSTDCKFYFNFYNFKILYFIFYIIKYIEIYLFSYIICYFK